MSIGAINCFFRKDNSLKSAFTGTNTDGEAALDPILQILKRTKKFKYCFDWYGGAGKAILAFLNKNLGLNTKIFLTEQKLKNFSKIRYYF